MAKHDSDSGSGSGNENENETLTLEAIYRGELMNGSSNPCPSDEELAELLLEDLTAEARAMRAEHVVRCRDCAAKFRLLSRLDDEAATAPAKRIAGRARLSRGRLARSAVAAAFMLFGIGVGTFLWTSSTPAPPNDSFRGGEDDVSPSAGERLPEAPYALSWPPQPRATGYRVQLHGSDGAVLWSSSVGGATRAIVPPETRVLLEAGRAYFWTVEVEGPVSRGRLGPYTFEIR